MSQKISGTRFRNVDLQRKNLGELRLSGQERILGTKTQNSAKTTTYHSWAVTFLNAVPEKMSTKIAFRALTEAVFVIFVTSGIPKTRSWPENKAERGFYVPELSLLYNNRYGYALMCYTHILIIDFLAAPRTQKMGVAS